MTIDTRDDDELPRHEGIVLVTGPSLEYLNPRQAVDYESHRRKFVKWLLNLGKDPSKAEGYAHATARRRASDTDVFARWAWQEQRDGYTLELTHDDVDAYHRQLAYKDCSDEHRANIQKSLKCYFRFRDDPWEPEISFSGSHNQRSPRDYLTKEERRLIREASLEYGTVPSYSHVTPKQRTEWKNVLARRFRKPSNEIGPEDFRKANGFKIPSLVWTAIDCGLRPAEVGSIRPHWIDVDNAVVRIPAEDATKHRDNWEVPIRDRTASMVAKWLSERQCYEKYDATGGEYSDRLWLTRESQPYSSRTLNYLLDKLCETASIDTADRDLTWYAIRHSTGTYMAREEGLEAAAAQLRHTNITTTRKYDQTPVEDRRDALDQIE